MKQKTKATVISQQCIGPDIYDLWISTPLAKEAHAGQFIGVYPNNQATLLPRPISICEVSDNKDALRLVYRIAGKGTKEFSSLKEKDEIDIIGILGNGYIFENIFGEDEKIMGSPEFDKKYSICLMGGGIGIPPMLQLAKELSSKGVKPTVIVGYRDASMYLNHDLALYSNLLIATEDGSVGEKGNVLNVVDNKNLSPNVIMACGPMPMLRAIKNYAEKESNNTRNIRAFISLEERMACGVGACLGCVCKTKNVDHHSHVNNARICTDGPVFEASEVDI